MSKMPKEELWLKIYQSPSAVEGEERDDEFSWSIPGTAVSLPDQVEKRTWRMQVAAGSPLINHQNYPFAHLSRKKQVNVYSPIKEFSERGYINSA